MSNRLTFSLASLILIFSLAFVAMPVMGAPGGPTVTITEYSGKDDYSTTGADHVQERVDFRLKVEFSVPVRNWDDTDIIVLGAADLTSALTAYTGATVTAATGADAGKVWYVAINIATNDTAYAHSVISASIAADMVTGNIPTNRFGNQAKTQNFTSLPGATAYSVTAKIDPDNKATVASGKLTMATTFNVLFEYSGGTGAFPTEIPDAQIQIKDKDGKDINNATTGVTVTTTAGAATGNMTSAGFTVGAADVATPIQVGVNPNWAGSASTFVWIPSAPGAPDPTITTQPTAEIMISSADGLTMEPRAFVIEVTFTPGENSNGDAVDVTPGDDFHTAVIKGEDSNENAVSFTKIDSQMSKNSYRGVLQYNTLSVPPLTITLARDGDNNYKSTSTPADDASGMVGMAEETNNPPMFAAETATRSVAENTAAGMDIGDPVAATDADDDMLTYTLGGTDMASFAIVSDSGQLQTMAALDYETKMSYMVTVTADDGNGGMDSIAVTINVTDVDETPDNMPPAFDDNLATMITGKSGVAITPVTFSATDPEKDAITYSWDVDEDALGLMLNATTGTVSGKPNKAHSASHVITATAMGGMDTHTVMVTITGNTAPTFAAYTFPALTVNMAHPVTLPAANDEDGDTLTYSIMGTLPTGLSSSASGTAPLMISGTPTAVGTSSVMYMASDGRGGEASLNLTITVSAAPPEQPQPTPGRPDAPSGLMATVNANKTVTLTWTEPSGTITSYTVQVTAVGATTGSTVTLSGRHSSHTTAALTAGTTYTIRVAARNAQGTGGSASTTVSIPADPATPPATPAIILPAGIPDVGASFTAGTGRVVGTTTLSGSIAADSFGVVLADDLPDLEQFFRMTGTIVLSDGTSAATTSAATEGLGTRAVLISEILWGLDRGEPADSQDRRQFIELYNTSKSGTAALDVTGWTLTFTLHRTAPPNVVDRVSNTGLSVDPGWVMDIGQSGVLTGTTLAGVSALGGQGVPVDIISAYRNINYGGVQGGDLKADHVRWGHQKGSWKASTRITTQVGIKASPGARHFTVQGPLSKSGVSRSPFIINEIGNATGGTNDWIEIRNVTDSVQSLKNYQLSVVTSDKKDTQLFNFHDQDYKVPAKGVILITHSDPSTSDLAGGNNAAKGDLDEVLEGATHIYVVPTKGPNGGKFDIPDSGKTLLILRNNHEGKHLGTGNQIVDWIGTLSIQDVSRGTNLWPLSVWGGPHGNVVKNGDEDFRAGKVYQRNNTNADGKEAIEIRGYTGVGYDRHAAVSAENGGTPGYDNGVIKHKYSDFSGKISVSEIMLVTEEEGAAGRVPRATRLPQWIELYNNSMTQAVTISNWHLEIQNDDTEGFLGNLHGTLRLPGIVIQPNQTVLIVSASGLNSGNFPPQRTVNVFLNGTWRRELGLVNRGDVILNPAGFYVELRDHENRHVDEIGNLGVSRRTGTGRRDNFGSEWEIPSLHSVDGHRTSLIRIYDKGIAENGLMEDSWRRAADTNFRNVPSLTYYGNHRDFGTPGYRGGGPLPVQLSNFRPIRLESGEVVIRWITQSELNNAGFNILRSDTRDGEFKQINTKLIAGQGTTSEKTTYEWKDTSAKPNVVYYYQIQDVSIDGQVQTLKFSRLKGHISPAGKSTTTWGELKALQ